MENNHSNNKLSLHPEIVSKEKIFCLTDISKRKTKIVCTLG